MTPEELKAIDEGVWEALGFGDLWFPPDVPTCGPDWCAEIKTIPCLLPGKKDWSLHASFPPVSRDWNLAMWAADKVKLFYTEDMNPPHALVMMMAGWEIAEITASFEVGKCLRARSKSGPLCICQAILFLHALTRQQPLQGVCETRPVQPGEAWPPR